MIRINLLPHREEKRKAQQIRFFVVAGISAATALFVVAVGYSVLEQRIASQEGRNSYLKTEIDKLDKQIAEIEVLRTKRKDLLDRKQVVERLQANRGEMVRMLDQLTRQTPEGIYLLSLKNGAALGGGGKEATIRLVGRSLSNARISTFMRSLNDSPAFDMPTLVEIKAVKAGDQRLSEFIMDVPLTRTVEDKGEADKTGKAAANPAAAKK